MSSIHTTTQEPANGRGTDFVAVEGGAEQYSGGNLLVVAYAIIWIAVFAWIFLLWRKQRALTQRLDGLQAAIDRTADVRAGANDGGSKVAPASSAAP